MVCHRASRQPQCQSQGLLWLATAVGTYRITATRCVALLAEVTEHGKGSWIHNLVGCRREGELIRGLAIREHLVVVLCRRREIRHEGVVQNTWPLSSSG